MVIGCVAQLACAPSGGTGHNAFEHPKTTIDVYTLLHRDASLRKPGSKLSEKLRYLRTAAGTIDDSSVQDSDSVNARRQRQKNKINI